MDIPIKEWVEYYDKRAEEIFIENFSRKMKKNEEEELYLRNKVVVFLKEKLNTEDFETAVKYLDEFIGKKNENLSLWNEIFYRTAINDLKKLKKEFPEFSLWNP